jgi:hypothetical protein
MGEPPVTHIQYSYSIHIVVGADEEVSLTE